MSGYSVAIIMDSADDWDQLREYVTEAAARGMSCFIAGAGAATPDCLRGRHVGLNDESLAQRLQTFHKKQADAVKHAILPAL